MARITASFTSLSWIPSEAITGVYKVGLTLGVAQYDQPPPEQVDDLAALLADHRFRFANELAAFVDVDDDGRIVAAGHLGHGHMGATVLGRGPASTTIPGMARPDLTTEPEVGDTWVRFVQTAGGRTGVPLPRRVNRPPWVQVLSPIAWTTLALTIHADGRVEREVVGASPFPRHWYYVDGVVVQKSGLTDWKSWMSDSFGDSTPWGPGGDTAALVVEVESQLERMLSALIMQDGRKPRIERLATGDLLTTQGERDRALYLVLDGMLEVEVDGNVLAEVGPGAILGERSILEDGVRTSTLRAVTPCRIAVAAADDVDRAALEELAASHRREVAPAVGDTSA